MLDLCGNMSGGAKPCFSASWGLGSMPTKSWFCRYEFMGLPGRKTNFNKKLVIPSGTMNSWFYHEFICLLQCLQILTERYVIHMFMNRLCISDIPTNGILLNQMYINY